MTSRSSLEVLYNPLSFGPRDVLAKTLFFKFVGKLSFPVDLSAFNLAVARLNGDNMEKHTLAPHQTPCGERLRGGKALVFVEVYTPDNLLGVDSLDGWHVPCAG